MLKKIIDVVQIPIKIMLVCMMAYGIYSYFNQVFINEDVDYGASFHSLPENSMDVIVLGSSHAQYSFVPSFFYEDTGLYSYVMGSPCQPLEVSYEMLKEALKTQSPKMVVLEVYTAMPHRKVCEADVCYVAGQYLMTGAEKYNTINYLEEEKAKTYYNDFLNLHNNWKYTETIDDWKIDSQMKKLDSNIDSSFGYRYQKPAFPIENHWRGATFESSIDVELDELDLISLNNIYNLCNDNGIELLLYKTPIDGMDVENQSYLRKVWQWAEERNIDYIDFFQLQSKLDYWMCIYSDSYHNNINGAGVITGEISDFVNNKYEFEHTKNEILEDMYSNNALRFDIDYIKYEYNIYKSFRRMKHEDATVLIKYGATNVIMHDRLRDEIIEFGFDDFDVFKDYYAIVKDGELIVSGNDNVIMDYNGKEIVIDKDIVSIDGNEIETMGSLSLIMLDKSLDSYTVKNIDYSDYPWEYGYDYYYKK